MEATIPNDEPVRLAALYAMKLLDQGTNENFDRVTRLAAGLFGVPIALVSLVDADRQWFASRVGLDAAETPRCDAFCAHAILRPDVFVVEDARADPRFSDNPLVLGPPNIRFYAGAPISSSDGHLLGTVCVIDSEPRSLDDSQKEALRDLADLAERELQVIGMALTDQLTGLANRRAFVQAGSQLVHLAHRRQEPVAALYADVDGLKLINDRSGHVAGDELICRAGGVLQDAVRGSDLVARVGGDEFAVLMYGTDAAAANNVQRHIEDELDRHNAAFPEKPTLSLSVGVVEAVRGETIENLVGRADQTMYMAKREARALLSLRD